MLVTLRKMLRPLRTVSRLGSGQAPVNFRPRDASPTAILNDAEYALKIGREYLELIAAEGENPASKTVLELGPGPNYGALMVLACAGARPVAADRFPVAWDNAYHSAFYAKLAELVKSALPQLDTDPLSTLAHAGAHSPFIIKSVAGSAEELNEVKTGSVDIVLSNAVLEHLQDPAQAFAQLYRITKAGGLGLHQVDFRDHRDFSRPLEYLLLPTDEFEAMFTERHGECGRQMRPAEMQTALQKAGFIVRHFSPNIDAADDYLADVTARLQTVATSPYRNWTADQLKVVSGRFHLRKPLSA